MKIRAKLLIIGIIAYCTTIVFLAGGCSTFIRSDDLERKSDEPRIIEEVATSPTNDVSGTSRPSDDYLQSIYPDSNEELRNLLYYKDRIIDSLYTKIDYIYFRVDSLHQELLYYDGRVTINHEFEIPRKFEFAGRQFDLSNERAYHMFGEIFERELQAAHRYIPRSGMYFPLFESVLAEHGVPDDIKYLAIAESGLASMATSPVGAGGIWQFMPATARHYNLRIDSFIDERRNIFKATEAAARYLRNSYNYLSNLDAEDWLLSMCAYNAGDGAVARVMREQQATDFFDLIMRVDETNRYVWRTAAIKLIFDYEEELFGEKFEREPSILDVTRKETITLNGHHKIDDWVRSQGTVLRRVWELNPWLNIYQRQRRRYSAINDIVLPAGEYEILLPVDSEPDQELVARAEQVFLDRNHGYYTYHTVRRGDTLYGIARRYGVTVASIQAANNLRSNIIRTGQRLQLFGAQGGSPGSSSISSDVYTVRRGDTLSGIAQRSGTSVANLRRMNNLSSDLIRPGQNLKLSSGSSGQTQVYTVRRGDSLSGIAQRYGTNASTLMRINNLSNTVIHPGQNLNVPSGESTNVYIVQRGDSVGAIAQRLNVSTNHLISRNNLTVRSQGNQKIIIIQPGQRLYY